MGFGAQTLQMMVVGLVLSYVIPLFLSLIGRRTAEISTCIGCAVALGLSGAIAYGVLIEHRVAEALGGLVILDPVGSWGLLVVALLGLCESIYSVGYVRHDERLANGVSRVYYLLFNATMLSMALAVLSNNIVFMWVSIEATTLATAFLIGIYRSETAVEAAWKYIIICGVGVGFALFGTAMVYNAALANGVKPSYAMSWSGLIANSSLLSRSPSSALLRLGLVLITIGYSTKAGLFPLHVWLPDAHSEAPTPISAVLSGVIVKCALIVILRWYSLALSLGLATYESVVLLVMGLGSIFVGSLAILAQRDIKRMFAYSTVDQVGMIATALGVGGPLGVLAAVLHVMYHAFAKALAFMGSGLVMLFTHGVRDMEALKGLISRGLSVSAGIIIAAVLGVIALPPGPSFYSKALLFFASMSFNPVVAAIVLLGILIGEGTLMYKVVTLAFSSNHGGSSERFSERGASSCKASCYFLAMVILALFAFVAQYVSVAKLPMQEVLNAKHILQAVLHG